MDARLSAPLCFTDTCPASDVMAVFARVAATHISRRRFLRVMLPGMRA